jgi:hypothetical protein
MTRRRNYPLPGCDGSVQVEQLTADLAMLREEFATYRTRTDAAIDALLQMRSIVPLAVVENFRPQGNWKSVKYVMDFTGRTNSAVHKWIKSKKIRVYQPGGPRTAIEIDVDSLPPKVSRSVNTPDGHTAG